MTVAELLNAKQFQELRVINKKADLNRIIFTVESTETPDVVAYLSKNAFLITTGMIYKDNQAGLCSLITKLNDLPCAGLAIKLGRFINELDPQVIALANKLQFPLIQIPTNYTLGEVSQKMLAYIWNDQNEELIHALNTQKKFSMLLLQGVSMKVMLNNIALVTKKPAAILDPFGDIMECTHTCIKEHLTIAKEVFGEISTKEHMKGKVEFVRTIGEKEEAISVYPIYSIGKNPYYLYFFDSAVLYKTVSSLVIEQFIQVLGPYLFKELYARCNIMKQKEAVFHILVNSTKGEKWSSSQLLMLGEKYGLKTAQNYRILMGTIEHNRHKKFDFTNLSYEEERYMLIYDWLDAQITKKFHGKVILFPASDAYQFIFIIQDAESDIEQELKRYHEQLLSLLQAEIIFAFGNRVIDLVDLDTSYNTALQSHENGKKEGQFYYIRNYAPKDAKELLKMIANEQIESFCSNNLKALAYPEDEMMLELRKTLKTYLECKCSITETANTMFLHRNTVKYRINKCKEILGSDFSDPAYCFQLQLSLVLAGDVGE
jgi:Purine catabolism regulatory protein-like family.